MIVFAERSGQIVEVAMGESLNDAPQRSHDAVLIEPHFLANKTVFEEKLLYVIGHRILAFSCCGKAEEEQGKEEFLHEENGVCRNNPSVVAKVNVLRWRF